MRRRRASRREILPDYKYNSKLVSRFINTIMLKGKKMKAQKILYKCLDIIAARTKMDALEVFTKAIENVRPLVAVKSRRIGGATYQVPVEVRPDHGIGLAIRWIRDAARTRAGKPMEEKLADELISAYKNEGAAIKKRQDTHKMAEANKAFSHYRW